MYIKSKPGRLSEKGKNSLKALTFSGAKKTYKADETERKLNISTVGH